MLDKINCSRDPSAQQSAHAPLRGGRRSIPKLHQMACCSRGDDPLVCTRDCKSGNGQDELLGHLERHCQVSA